LKYLSFKDKYTFTLYLVEGDFTVEKVIKVNPVERILEGLKTTTMRMKRLQLRLHQVRQGNYKKPIKASFQLKILKVEPRQFNSLSLKEIQSDIGLNDSEFKLIEESQGDLGDVMRFFLEKFREISGVKTFAFEDVAFLHYLEVHYVNDGNTLDKFIKNVAKPEFHEGSGKSE
jgi:hypothetical protein